jgi:serine/threonine-protein kinase
VVPNVSGWAQATAREKLRSTGLTLLIKREESDTVEAGSVIRTVPEAGTYVEAGTTVTVYVSRPKEDTASLVPSCVGLTQSVALQKLSALRLSANFVTVSSTEPQGTVLSQSPAAGTLLAKGGSVTLRVSSGQDPDVDPSGHVHQWLPTDENGWRVCYICLERQQVG